MEFVDDLTKIEYEKFVSSYKKTHFMQSYYFGKIREHKGFKSRYVGIKENNKLICASLILEKKLFGKFCYYYIPRGYVIDYSDSDLLTKYTHYLKEYAKKNGSLFIKIDPDIKRHDLDIDGNIIGNNNYELINKLIKLGYKHKGYNIGFENEQPRFTFRLNLDDDFNNIYGNFHPTTRKILNKGNQYNINIYKGNINDIDSFYLTMKETAKREGILQAPIDYYKNFYKIFNDSNHSDLYIAKININDLKKKFEKNREILMKEIDSLNDSKYKNESKSNNKKNDLIKKLQKMDKDYQNIEAIDQEEVILSSIITVKYKDMVWTVHGGNNSILMNLNANYLLYYTIIKDAYDEGYKCIDFFGTCGIANPSSDNPIFGIHSFKKRLGGEYTEFIGEFDLVIRPFLYFCFTTFVPIYRKIIRAIKNR